MNAKKITAPGIAQAKGQSRIVVITAYDAGQAAIAESAGADVLLVGDSLGMTVLGQQDTLGVTMEHMIHHCRAASAGCSRALLVADMPFMSYQAEVSEAVRNAGRLVKEGRAQAVKLEGGQAVLEQVRAIVAAGIPVMGHLGLTPQHVAAFGGFKVQAKTAQAARRLVAEARALEEAGVFSMVLECVPVQAAQSVTAAVGVPTIGIGAGPHCDGQVLVYHDLLGLSGDFRPKFVKRYADLGSLARKALEEFAGEVRQGAFPGPEHSFEMDPREQERFRLDRED